MACEQPCHAPCHAQGNDDDDDAPLGPPGVAVIEDGDAVDGAAR